MSNPRNVAKIRYSTVLIEPQYYYLPMFEHAMGNDSKKTLFPVVLEPLIGKVLIQNPFI